ncbi:sigma-70 family RNA polymerase sigma factor [Pseudanabaena sp. PCC 6802]|uniref:sigma-70 family RNA polymerase sigma factor n=1 Tax=Pseudanabaena sp. PCC 6802 TaxID=118173 RepID=UPI0003485479|nr:sigma-70 family RNA polymerase sigma factor [Pseudanabaena sp. PCC 6802]
MAQQQYSVDEAHLLERITAKDQAALSILYDRYARIIYTLAYRVLGSVEESEEVVLDVFNQVWRIAGTYTAQKGRVDAWLFMLTRSRALDRLRSLARTTKATVASEELAMTRSPSDTPEENAILLERSAVVKSALAQLPVEQREVLELAYYKGMTHTQIALATGKSLGTIKTRIRLGLNKLRESLKAIGEDD